MQIKSPRHVVIFSIAISLFAAAASVLYDWTMIPQAAFERNLGWRMLFSASLGFGVAAITGHRMLRENKLKQSLEYALSHDTLTGTYSRRTIFERLQKSRRATGFLVLADIDHFKSINDRFGHAAGDLMLQHFGATARHYLQMTLGEERAAIGRIGGEEFLIHIDMPAKADLNIWIDGLRAALRRAPALQGNAPYPLTASYGVTKLDGCGVDQAMLDADEALYAAKAAGRDCAVMTAEIAAFEGRAKDVAHAWQA